MSLVAEVTLHNSEQIFKNVFKLAGVGIGELAIDGSFIMVNAPFAKIAGYTEEELIGMNFREITYLDDLEIDNTHVEALLAGRSSGYSLEKRYIRKDGSIIWVNLTVTLVYDSEQKPAYFLSIVHDIHDKKKTEFELKKQAKALFYSPVSIIITDKQGVIEYINPAFTQITGFTTDDVIGKTPRLQASGKMSASFYKTLWDTLLKGELWRGTFINKKKNGELYWEEAYISPVFDTENQITHFVAVKEDITESIKAQQALLRTKQEAEKANKSKGIFIAHMSHEIRTPLNAILGFSKLLIDDKQLSIQQKRRLEMIYKNGEHLLNLINQILEVSKIEAGILTINEDLFELQPFIQDLYNTFCERAKEKGLAFVFHFEENLPKLVMTDEIKLRQILINLIENAVKYTDNGVIAVRCSIKNEENNSNLYFSIKDTGLGIGKENIERIFENFSQVGEGHSASGGTGLGLSITKQYISSMGGEITVKSELGLGSEFSFYIPVKFFNSQMGETTQKSILFVDDMNETADKNTPEAVLQQNSLPEPIKERLIQSIQEGDIDNLECIIDSISSVSFEYAETIKTLSSQFEFDKLLKLLS